VPFEVRNGVNDGEVQQGSLEVIKVKLMLLGSDDTPAALRMEMSSEADLFFHYVHSTDSDRFSSIQKDQKLMIDFTDYPGVLIKMLNLCIVEPHVHLGILSLSDDTARLDFVQNMEYKFIDLLHCNCNRSPDSVVQASITQRYNSMKHKMNSMHNRLQEIYSLIKIKNPSLLLQLQKASSAPNNNGAASGVLSPSSSTMGSTTGSNAASGGGPILRTSSSGKA
jgi:hypothetical protein